MSEHHSSTMANADLWSRYFQDQWSRWLNPFGAPAGSPVSELAEGTAARVASFLTFVAAGPIAWLYSENEGRVTQLVVGDDEHVDELPLDELPLELVGSIA